MSLTWKNIDLYVFNHTKYIAEDILEFFFYAPAIQRMAGA